MIVGITLLIACLWLRLLLGVSFWFVILGNCFAGIARPLISNAPAKISNKWFGQDERPVATAITCLADPIGSAVGFLFPTIFMSDNAIDKGEEGKKELFQCSLYVAIIFSAGFILAVLFFREAPPSPPSPSASEESERKESNFRGIYRLLSHTNFTVMSLCASIVFLVLLTLSSSVSPILYPFGYKHADTSKVGAVLIISGIFGSFLHGVFLSKTKRYKLSFNFFKWI